MNIEIEMENGGIIKAELYPDVAPITVENFVYMKQLALLSPTTKVFSNMEPTMIYYEPKESGVNITIGKDALYYHQDCPGLMWNQDEQPYGFAGVRRLFEALKEVAG